MALIHVYYYSKALNGKAEFFAIAPNDASRPITSSNPHYQRPPKTMILLHGHTGGAVDMLTDTLITQYAAVYNLNVLIPGGGNSFFVDCAPMDAKWGTFVGEELPAYAERTLGFSKTNMIISGGSMGGYGALHVGLKHPETFERIIAYAPALIFRTIAEAGKQGQTQNCAYFETIFGDLNTAQEREVNPEVLVKRLIQQSTPIPPMYIICGTEDFLLEENTRFASFLDSENVPHVFHTGPGTHGAKTWNAYFEQALQWALSDECPKA